MSKKCTLLWRKAHFQVKMLKTPHVRTTCGRSDVVLRGGTKDCAPCQKWGKREWFVAISTTTTTTLHYTTPHYTTLHSTQLQLQLHLCYITPHYTTLHSTQLQLQLQRQLPLQLQLQLCYITLHYTTLDYTRLHYTTPHYTLLHYANYITLHYTTPRYTRLHYTTLHYITLHSLHHHKCNCNYNTPQLQLHLSCETSVKREPLLRIREK